MTISYRVTTVLLYARASLAALGLLGLATRTAGTVALSPLDMAMAFLLVALALLTGVNLLALGPMLLLALALAANDLDAFGLVARTFVAGLPDDLDLGAQGQDLLPHLHMPLVPPDQMRADDLDRGPLRLALRAATRTRGLRGLACAVVNPVFGILDALADDLGAHLGFLPALAQGDGGAVALLLLRRRAGLREGALLLRGRAGLLGGGTGLLAVLLGLGVPGKDQAAEGDGEREQQLEHHIVWWIDTYGLVLYAVMAHHLSSKVAH